MASCFTSYLSRGVYLYNGHRERNIFFYNNHYSFVICFWYITIPTARVGVALLDNENGKLTTSFAYKVYLCIVVYVILQRKHDKKPTNIQTVCAILIEIYHYVIVHGDACAFVCENRLVRRKLCRGYKR